MLSAADAAAAVAEGLRAGGAEAVELPVADGGEGTAESIRLALGGQWREATVSDPLGRPVQGRWLALPDGRAVVEAAAAIGLPLLTAEERDPLRASSAGFGELIRAALDDGASGLVLGLGGSATVDGGAGLLGAIDALEVPATVLCDVSTRLADAARLFGPQKGASPEDVAVLEQRLLGMDELRSYAELPGSGAAGGLGASLAALGADLVPGADAVLDLVGFDSHAAASALVVTGEGSVDVTTGEGKAPGAVARRCRRLDIRCVVAGGVVSAGVEGAEVVALSGDPARCAEDLRDLGLRLASET